MNTSRKLIVNKWDRGIALCSTALLLPSVAFAVQAEQIDSVGTSGKMILLEETDDATFHDGTGDKIFGEVLDNEVFRTSLDEDDPVFSERTGDVLRQVIS